VTNSFYSDNAPWTARARMASIHQDLALFLRCM